MNPTKQLKRHHMGRIKMEAFWGALGGAGISLGKCPYCSKPPGISAEFFWDQVPFGGGLNYRVLKGEGSCGGRYLGPLREA